MFVAQGFEAQIMGGMMDFSCDRWRGLIGHGLVEMSRVSSVPGLGDVSWWSAWKSSNDPKHKETLSSKRHLACGSQPKLRAFTGMKSPNNQYPSLG